MNPIWLWVLDHVPILIAAVGALYAGRKVYTIEVNTNSRLSSLIKTNEDLRLANTQILVKLSRQSGRIEGTESPISPKTL